MSGIGAVLSLILLAFQLVLVARVILDWSTVLAGPPAIGGFRQRAISIVMRVTEPVLAPVRRVIPPLRIGGAAIDLSFIVVFLAVVILRSVVVRF